MQTSFDIEKNCDSIILESGMIIIRNGDSAKAIGTGNVEFAEVCDDTVKPVKTSKTKKDADDLWK